MGKFGFVCRHWGTIMWETGREDSRGQCTGQGRYQSPNWTSTWRASCVKVISLMRQQSSNAYTRVSSIFFFLLLCNLESEWFFWGAVVVRKSYYRGVRVTLTKFGNRKKIYVCDKVGFMFYFWGWFDGTSVRSFFFRKVFLEIVGFMGSYCF